MTRTIAPMTEAAGPRAVRPLPVVFALVLALILGAARRASAQEPAEPIRLDVTSSGGCPDLTGFEALVHARTRRALFVTSGSGTRSIEVRMQDGPHPSGSLVLRRGDAVEGTRSVQARTCTDVAEALALVVTLAVDPAASFTAVAPAPSAAGPADASASAPPPLSPPAVPPAARPPPPAPPPTLPPPAPTAARPATARPPTSTGPLPHTLWLGADFALAAGVSRDTLFGVAPSLGWRASSSSLFAPSVRLGFLRATTGSLSSTEGAASFTWTVGRADGCALSWPKGAARLLGCARIELGALQGAGTTVASPQTANRAWVAAGPLVRGEWELLSPMFMTADLALMVHVTEDRFYFLPDTTVYQVPVFGFEAGVGLGVHFH
jgi:hypothetical protein